MKPISQKIYILFLFQFLTLTSAYAQNTLKGRIIDDADNQPLIGVNIVIKGTINGTTTNSQGEFKIQTQSQPPFELVFSMVGYENQSIVFEDWNDDISISLKEQTTQGKEVVISASRVEESVLQSTVTIEKLDLLQLRNSASSSFYDALKNLKGVDVTTHSLTFQAPNTRGFGANSNLRMLQLIDGVDNQGPGLGFSPGNLLGASELDIESVELLPGASSVLFGPGAINGTLLMKSKSPFEYQGLSSYVRFGMNNFNSKSANPSPLLDFGFRYAKALNDKFAFKINMSYLEAQDWHANDYRNRTTSNGVQFGTDNSTLETNSGYYGVNNYGGQIATDLPIGPVVGRDTTNINVARTGYNEIDLVDYTTKSLKANLALHYRISENIEAIFQGGLGYGTSLYTGATRVQLKNFLYYQAKAEIKGSNFFLRVYTTQERSGDSYDIGFTALAINRAWKSDEQWFQDYALAYTGGASQIGANLGNSSLRDVAANDANAARKFADGDLSNVIPDFIIKSAFGPTGTTRSSLGRSLPGSTAFNKAKDQAAKLPYSQGGALFFDQSNLYHTEGMYNFNKIINPKELELVIGAHFRLYELNSNGTVFDDATRKISIWEAGGYIQAVKKLFNEHVKVTASARFDKNQNFDGRFTPRLGIVYTTGAQKQHNFRIAYQTAFRNPSVTDQYLNLTVNGIVKAIGGLPEFISGNNLRDNTVVASSADIGNYINTFRTSGAAVAKEKATYNFSTLKPENVVSLEAGYKGLLGDNFFVDTYAYYNRYQNFIGNQTLVAGLNGADISTVKFTNTGGLVAGTYNIYQLPVNSATEITTYGWGIGFDYKFYKGYSVGGNISMNELGALPSGTPAGFRSQFNTPKYRTNISLSNRKIGNTKLGFNVVYRWQDSFIWQNTFGDGVIPMIHTFDAQVSYTLTQLKTIVKLGGTNLSNQYYVQSFGTAQIGGLYYVSILFDNLLN
jgi:iron complex outermembrane recepter protein